MPGGFAPRFSLETAFLVLLGVGAGLAGFQTLVIVAVVAGGWALVTLIELAVWRAQTAVLPPLPAALAAAAEAEPEPALETEPAALDAEEPAYPLRSGADFEPLQEAEDYTRILSADEGAEGKPAAGDAAAEEAPPGAPEPAPVAADAVRPEDAAQ